MKCFFYGALGAVVLLTAAAVTFAQYSDYRSRAEFETWIMQLEPTRKTIELNILNLKGTHGSGVGIKKPLFTPNNVVFSDVLESGIIIVKGGLDGQMLALVPSLSGTGVAWQCIGGSDKAVSSKCHGVSDGNQ